MLYGQMSHDMTKPTKWQNQQIRRLRSAWASAQSDQKTKISLGIRPVWTESSLCAQWVAKDPSFLHADSEDWSDWADAQADLSPRWAHNHFVGFVMSRLKLFTGHCFGPLRSAASYQNHLCVVTDISFSMYFNVLRFQNNKFCMETLFRQLIHILLTTKVQMYYFVYDIIYYCYLIMFPRIYWTFEQMSWYRVGNCTIVFILS